MVSTASLYSVAGALKGITASPSFASTSASCTQAQPLVLPVSIHGVRASLKRMAKQVLSSSFQYRVALITASWSESALLVYRP